MLADKLLAGKSEPRGLYRRSWQTWLAVHSRVLRNLASVADRVMCERLVSHRHSSGTSSPEAAPRAAAIANSSATSLQLIPWCAGTQRMVTALFLDMI